MNLSIIIPTFQEASRIEGVLEDIHQKSSGELTTEIIVVDAGTDETAVKARDLGSEVLTSPVPCRAVQLNLGGQLARGKVLYFLHADSRLPPAFDQKIVSAVARGYAGCFRLQFDWDHWLLRWSAYCTRFRGNFFRGGDQSLFVSREMFEEVGGFNEDMALMEDYDMVKRLVRHGNWIILPQTILTSARKYRLYGAIRLQWIYLKIQIRYRMGQTQEELLQYYQRQLNRR